MSISGLYVKVCILITVHLLICIKFFIVVESNTHSYYFFLQILSP